MYSNLFGFQCNFRLSLCLSKKKKSCQDFDRKYVIPKYHLGINIFSMLSILILEYKVYLFINLNHFKNFFNEHFLVFRIRVLHMLSLIYYFILFSNYKWYCLLNFSFICLLLVFRSATDFCLWILYPMNLKNLFPSSGFFL